MLEKRANDYHHDKTHDLNKPDAYSMGMAMAAAEGGYMDE